MQVFDISRCGSTQQGWELIKQDVGDACSPMLCACQPEETHVKHCLISCSMSSSDSQQARRRVPRELQLCRALASVSNRFWAFPVALHSETHITRITPGVSWCTKLFYM